MAEGREAAVGAPDDRVRLFVAVNLPPALRAHIAESIAPVREVAGRAVAWTAVDNLHLTLRFLGEQPLAIVPGLSAALAAAAAGSEPDRLTAEGAGAFPSAGRPRVLWMGLRANVALAALYQRVDAACDALGLGREARPFHPHLTLGRVRPGQRPPPDVVARLAAALPDPLDFPLRTVDLMSSRLSPGGSRYACLAALPLGGAPGRDGER